MKKAKVVTLYPGRYIYVCPCGGRSTVMIVARKNSNIGVHCWYCKQEIGKYYKVEERELDFGYNWNGKLNNECFTTMRLHNQIKYCVGNTFRVILKGQFKGRARCLSVNTFTIDRINEFVARLDTGYSASECRKIIQTMYKNKPYINWNTQLLDLCLLEYIKEKDKDLFNNEMK